MSWPDPTKPGVPFNAEQTAWHWVQLPTGEVYALWWRVEATSQPVWAYGTRGIPAPAFATTGIKYIGMCPTPNEVAALIAAEREACAAVVEQFSMEHGRAECCGNGQYSLGGGPPECCGDPDYMLSGQHAAQVIRNRSSAA